jgi:hypothetical protein
MGAFIVNLHVKTARVAALKTELRRITLGDAYVASPKNGWAAVYDEIASSQSESEICRLGEELSRRMKSHVIAFRVHDSDVLCYWLFEHGELIDQFNSNPGYFREGANEALELHLHGRPELLLPHCVSGTELKAIEAVLRQGDGVFAIADERLVGLAELLGIDESRALTDFRSIGSDADVHPQDLDLTLLKPRGTPRRRSRTPSDRDSRERPTGSPDPMQKMIAKAAERDLQAAIVSAVLRKDRSSIEQLLNQGADVNGRDPILQFTPLYAAVYWTCPEAVKVIIASGAHVNDSGPHGFPLLSMAVMGGSAEIVRMLIEAGADVNARNRADPESPVPLHYAAGHWRNAEIIRLLIDGGAEVTATTRSGQTALDVAEKWLGVEKRLHSVLRAHLDTNRDLAKMLRADFGEAAQVARLLREAGDHIQS